MASLDSLSFDFMLSPAPVTRNFNVPSLPIAIAEVVEDEPAKISLAPCRTAPELFFYATGEHEPARIRRDKAAKVLCNTCSIKVECLTGALERGEVYGVWGGTTEDERSGLLAFKA